MTRHVLLLLLVLVSACKEPSDKDFVSTEAVIRPVVLASNYPLYFFASRIAGDAVEVRMPEIDGDPAMWVPRSSDLAQIQNAELIFLNGAGYESWLAFTSLPTGVMVDTTAEVQGRLLPIDNVMLHQHGPEGEHSHAGTAFTTWLNPQIAIEQARVVSSELSRLVPAQSARFEERFGELEGQLSALDSSLTEAFSRLGDQPVVFSHPVYQYLQQRYGLNGQSVHWEPDSEPGVKDWIGFQNLLQDHPARLMIWEGQPLQIMIDRLQQQGIRSIVFEPVANRPENGDYFALMKMNLEQLASE